jgi:hypothetical protein
VSENYKSALEQIRAKYDKTETVSDDYGRVIVCRRLNTPQSIAVREWMANATSFDTTVYGTLTLGAMVAKIDDLIFPFPKNRQDVDATLGVLDEAGIAAVLKAYVKFSGDAISEQETIDAAKDSVGTSS